MDAPWKSILKRQFGASIDMLENAIRACPERVWSDRSRKPEFWYVAYHALFFLDFYLAETDAGFAPPAPFTLSEMDPSGLMPDRVYTQAELLRYLDHGRAKCVAAIEASTDESDRRRRGFPWGEVSGAELFLTNLRHVQHHAAQLNLLLRQAIDAAPGWVAIARKR